MFHVDVPPNNSLDFLSILQEEKKVEIKDGKIYFIDPKVIAGFNSVQLQALRLPPAYHQIFSCRSRGAVLAKNYQVIAIFKKIDGLPLGKYQFDPQRAQIVIANETYTTPCYLYESLQLIEKINDEQNHEQKLHYVKQLREVMPFKDFQKDGTLREIEVVLATKYQLDVADHQTFNLVPTFVEEVTEESGDRLRSVLPDNHCQQYQDKFLKSNRVRTSTQVAPNKFVVLDEMIEKVLNIVKDTQHKSIGERRALYINPTAYLTKKLGDDYSDKLNAMFIPSEQYKSDRIKFIGVWHPKTQSYLPIEGNEWFPKDCVGIMLDEQYIFVKPDNIDKEINKLEKAIANNKPAINIEGQTVKASNENLDLLKAVHDRQDEPDKKTTEKDDKKEETKVAPIIKDNIEEDLYRDKIVDRQQQQIFIPNNLMTDKLFLHQQKGVRWLQDSWNKGSRGVLLADDMGLGKTMQTLIFLAWIRQLQEDNKLDKKPLMIVGPIGLLKNWQAEHNKWLKKPGLGELVEGYGTKLASLKKRGHRYCVDRCQASNWLLTTYDSLASNEAIFREIEWQVIVFDECQAIKNPRAFRTDMAKAMDAQFTIAVTGTPVENRLCDLWCLSDTARPGFLGRYKEFREEYEKNSDNYNKLTKKLKEESPPPPKEGHKEYEKNSDNYDNLTKKLKEELWPPFMVRRMKEDHLDGLPKKTEIVREEQMPDKQFESYRRATESVNAGCRGKSMVVINHLKAASLCPHLAPDLSDEQFLNCSARLIALRKILDEIKERDEKVLIFLSSRKLQEKLLPVLQRRYHLDRQPLLINGTMSSVVRQNKVDEFQQMAKGFFIMVISPKAGGTGLTLTEANNVIHLDRWWNPAVEDQCSDRVYRIGQKKDVNIYLPLAVHPQLEKKCKGGFDKTLHELLTKKRELSRQVIIPTAFTNEDHKKLFEGATGSPFEEQDDFYQSQQWRDLRYQILNKQGHRCKKCGIGRVDGAKLQVDHIKPRSKYPELELDEDNLQVLCEECNMGKSNKYEDDYR